MELTINNIIKVAIGVFVVVVVVLGIYFAMSSYVIPYFSGIWSENQSTGFTGGSMETCQGKLIVGQIDDKGVFVYSGGGKIVPTKIYFEKDGYIKVDDSRIFSDSKLGRVYDVRIEIFSDSATTKVISKNSLKTYTDALNMAFIGGKEICKGV